jgi:hypothetical protein
LLLEQFSHEFHSRVLVAPSLHQQIETLAFNVDGSPAKTADPQSSRSSRRDAIATSAVGV